MILGFSTAVDLLRFRRKRARPRGESFLPAAVRAMCEGLAERQPMVPGASAGLTSTGVTRALRMKRVKLAAATARPMG